MTLPDRNLMLVQFKRLSDDRIGSGLWLQSDSDALAASIRAAFESRDANRIFDAACFLDAVTKVFGEMERHVRDSNLRMKSMAALRNERKAK